MKQTSCCKATYKDWINTQGVPDGYKCDKCCNECTLEDIPAYIESMEYKFDREFVQFYPKDYGDEGDEPYEAFFDKDRKNLPVRIKKFIKSERELWEKELVELLEKAKLPQNTYKNGMSTLMYIPDEHINMQVNNRIEWIINLIQEK